MGCGRVYAMSSLVAFQVLDIVSRAYAPDAAVITQNGTTIQDLSEDQIVGPLAVCRSLFQPSAKWYCQQIARMKGDQGIKSNSHTL